MSRITLQISLFGAMVAGRQRVLKWHSSNREEAQTEIRTTRQITEKFKTEINQCQLSQTSLNRPKLLSREWASLCRTFRNANGPSSTQMNPSLSSHVIVANTYCMSMSSAERNALPASYAQRRVLRNASTSLLKTTRDLPSNGSG